VIRQVGLGLKPNAFDQSAITYFSYLTGTVPLFYKVAINNLVRSLKTANIWNELDWMPILATPNRQNARIDLINPARAEMTEYNNPDFLANYGFTGNAVNQYIDTNFNLNTQGVKYSLNRASLFQYCRTNSDGTKLELGAVGAVGNQAILDIRDGNVFYTGVNEPSTNISSANNDSRGFFVAVRDGPTSVKQYKNGVLTVSGANASGAKPNFNVFLLAINNNGVPILFSDRQLSIIGAGSENINQATFYSIIQAFATEIGFNV